jgi:hypothetical protein
MQNNQIYIDKVIEFHPLLFFFATGNFSSYFSHGNDKIFPIDRGSVYAFWQPCTLWTKKNPVYQITQNFCHIAHNMKNYSHEFSNSGRFFPSWFLLLFLVRNKNNNTKLFLIPWKHWWNDKVSFYCVLYIFFMMMMNNLVYGVYIRTL